jgi:LytS/YehU family sensor histidine kinase
VCEKVKLLTEVEYIEDFIKLQRLLSSDVNINFTLSGNDFDRILIFPGILIAPVENAFKHGNLHSEENPIQVELKCSYKYLTLSVLNEKNKHKINEPSGIGNNNLKQQLDLLYKDKYYLSVKNEDCTYSCELKLALS